MDNSTSVCNYTGVNDDLSNNVLDVNVNLQNDHFNMSCTDGKCLHNGENLQLFKQSHNSADKVSSIQGESYCTQVTIQHNKGGDLCIMYKVITNESKVFVTVTVSQCLQLTTILGLIPPVTIIQT